LGGPSYSDKTEKIRWKKTDFLEMKNFQTRLNFVQKDFWRKKYPNVFEDNVYCLVLSTNLALGNRVMKMQRNILMPYTIRIEIEQTNC